MRYEKLFEALPKNLHKDYGQKLFGDERGLDEPDTEKEKELLKVINDWVGGESFKFNKETEKAFKILHSLKKYAPEILNPESNVLYRGVKFNLLGLGLKNIEKEDFEFDSSIGYYVSKKTYSYTPHKKIQSWTPKLNGLMKTIKGISGDSRTSSKYFIIFKCKFPEKSLLFNPTFLNRISYRMHDVEENEVLHFGNSKIKVQILLSEEDYDYSFNQDREY